MEMEMEKERQWMELGEEEEVGEGLEIRQRRRGKMGREIEEVPSKEEESSGEQRSVYFDSEQGAEFDVGKVNSSNHKNIVAEEEKQNSKDIEQLVTDGDLENGKPRLNNHEIIGFQQVKQTLNYISVKNGQNLHHQFFNNNENGITKRVDEIKEHGEVKVLKSDGLVVADHDVEKVLEEQETHDLYCPNCHSCITRRVILRKRKRTAQENHFDAPPVKLEQARHGQEASAASAESTELAHQNEPDIFRCLSCFSFFIPTENGFNIFRIFGKRDESKNLQSSEQTPARSMNWFSSIFKSETSKPKDSEAEVPLLTESNIPVMSIPEVPLLTESNILSSGNTSMEDSQSSQSSNILGAKELGTSLPTESNGDKFHAGKGREDQASIGNSYLDPLPKEPYTNGGQMEDQEGMQSTPDVDIIKPAMQTKPTVPRGTSESNLNTNGSAPATAVLLPPGHDIIKHSGIDEPSLLTGSAQSSQNIEQGSLPPTAVDLPQIETHIYVGSPSVAEGGRNNEWDLLKSIVYGGLIEIITSLGVVSSAAGADTSTLNIFALGIANLVGGLFVIAHDLSELRSAQDPKATSESEKPADRYWELLGKRSNFRLHATVAILSYIIFGLLPPIVYGFSFRKSDNKEYKLTAVAAASLLCIALLAIGKAHVRPQKGYIKSLLYYLGLGVPASGLSYVAGMMIHRLLLELGLFDGSTASPSPPSSIEFIGLGSVIPAWSSQ